MTQTEIQTPPQPRTRLARFHARLRGLPLAQRFTLFIRGMLFLGFVAPGLTKLLGLDFAPGIDAATPMGGFFRAFHGTGFFYTFVGGTQVVASLLLLSRRTALLGACLYMPVIGSIWVLVTATRFSLGTQTVTGLMALACLWLLAWDRHRLAPLFSPRARVGDRPVEPAAWDLLAPPWGMDRPQVRWPVRLGYALGLGGAAGLTLFTRGLAARALATPYLLTVLAGLLLTLLAWGMALRGRRPDERRRAELQRVREKIRVGAEQLERGETVDGEEVFRRSRAKHQDLRGKGSAG